MEVKERGEGGERREGERVSMRVCEREGETAWLSWVRPVIGRLSTPKSWSSFAEISEAATEHTALTHAGCVEVRAVQAYTSTATDVWQRTIMQGMNCVKTARSK